AGTALVTSADDPLAGYPMPILNKRGELNEQIEAFSDLFREIRPNSQLQRAPVEGQGTQTFTTVDYSLQLSQGIRNYYQALKFPPTPPMPVAPAAAFEAGDRARRVRRVVLPQVSRDEHDGR
ncbi:MAG: hypothetical protein NT069_15360, partial [Planctomycetota bacterium]|nr:hypothetical protein [Planctomycetota bacterium]